MRKYATNITILMLIFYFYVILVRMLDKCMVTCWTMQQESLFEKIKVKLHDICEGIKHMKKKCFVFCVYV